MSGPGLRLVRWILGVGLAATVVVAGVGIFLRAGDDAGDDATPPPVTVAVPPFAAPSGEPEMVPADRITVAASSFLAAEGAITYEPLNTIDGDLQTAWNSDAGESDGRGQVLTYRFTEPVGLSAIRLVNGYAKGEDIFAANHRIKELEVRTDRGSQRVSLLDTSDEQEITFDFGVTSKVELEVIEIYPGDGFDDATLTADLALTEIDFLASQR